MKNLFEINLLVVAVLDLVATQHTTEKNQVETCPCLRHGTGGEDFEQSHRLILFQLQAQLADHQIQLQNQSLQCMLLLGEHVQQHQTQYIDQQRNLQNQSLLQQRILEQMQALHIKQQTNLESKYENITGILTSLLLQNKQAEEQAGNNVRESRVNARSFLDSPRALSVTPGGGYVQGITALDCKLFLVRRTSSVYVFDNTNRFVYTRDIPITGSSSLHAIVASPRHNSLYISDTELKVVYRYNLSDNAISSWWVGDKCYGLSLTSANNVLVTLADTKKINEYTPDGSLVREISLDNSMEHPWHSIQLCSGQFVVCHSAAGKIHRVCVVDTSGRIIESYGGTFGSEIGQLHIPNNLAIDRYDNVLVSDWHNDRVVLLSPTMTRLGYIAIPGYTLSRPRSLHLDPLTRRLYIAEETGNGRLFVLTV